MSPSLLDSYGWNDAFERLFEEHAAKGLIPARVTIQQRGPYQVVTAQGHVPAELSGRFHFEAEAGGHPVAGDWVACTPAAEQGTVMIQALLPRRTSFVRKAAGPGGGSQVVAANVDLALLVASLNGDLNRRRIERYLATAWESGAQPVIVLTKADLCEDAETLVAQVRSVASGVPVHVASKVTGQGLPELAALLTPGKTAVLLGSSGAGKSSLVNALIGSERMLTQAIREDDARGRHTTTHRELVLLPNGGLLLDTPGMRELGLWEADAGVAAAFADLEREIDALAAHCRFRDCRHRTEPGCTVIAALAAGELSTERWQSYGDLKRELAERERKQTPAPVSEMRKVRGRAHKAARSRPKHGDADE
jgi:ribosome biogenesis GTPase